VAVGRDLEEKEKEDEGEGIERESVLVSGFGLTEPPFELLHLRKSNITSMLQRKAAGRGREYVPREYRDREPYMLP